MKNQSSGFTLIEIIITVLLLGIIASIAFNSYGTVIEKSTAKEAEYMLHAIFANTQSIKIETGSLLNVISGVRDPFVDNLPPSGNFLAPVVTFNGAPELRYTITRNPPLSYTLTMFVRTNTTVPVITCSGGPAGLCAKLGY